MKFPDKIPTKLLIGIPTMYKSILEYIVRADMFYRLWMVAQIQRPTDESKNVIYYGWMPELVELFDDVRDVPDIIRCTKANHVLDSDLRFHTGNKTPTIDVATMELFWGAHATDVFHVMKEDRGGHVLTHPIRELGPCKVSFNNLKFWHHQDATHRRRGDAIICEQVTFVWNTKEGTLGSYRDTGPFQIVIKDFRASYKMGVVVDASYSHLGVSWSTESGIRLGEEKVQNVIDKNGIKVNYLLADSVFGDEGEEFIFWDEIGRAQEAA